MQATGLLCNTRLQSLDAVGGFERRSLPAGAGMLTTGEPFALTPRSAASAEPLSWPFEPLHATGYK